MHRHPLSSLKFGTAASAIVVLLLGCSLPGTRRVSGGAAADSAAPAPVRAPAFVAGGNVAPDAPLTPDQQRWVDETMARLTPRERVAQLVTVWVLGDYTNADDPGFEQVQRWITEDHIGGVLMSLGSPIEVAAKVNYMQRLSPVPLLVSSDVEPGLGRLEGGVFAPNLMRAGSATVLPTNMAIGATGRDSNAFEAGRITGLEARAIGIHLAFAPTADVNNNPANPVINVRSFGEDPQAVARHVAAFVRGVQSVGMATTLKHFPGHGDTDTDSHNALPVVQSDRARLDSVELVPFRAGIAAGAAGVMSAHIALPGLAGDSTTPATLDKNVMTGLLRDSLGFRGLIATDALTMEGVGKGYTPAQSAVLALVAGADMLEKPADARQTIEAVMDAIARGVVTQARVDSSARRILELKARTNAAAQPIIDLDSLRAIVARPAHLASAARIASEAITLLRDSASLLPVSGRVAVVTYAPELEITAGRAFAAAMSSGLQGTRVIRIGPRTSTTELDTLARQLERFDRVIVTTHVRTIEGEGRFAIPTHVGAWIDTLATRGKVIVVASGNPYVIRQFPRVQSYVVTFGIGEALERAAARAVLGRAPITGRAPISLPGIFQRGDGITRAAATAAVTP